MSKGKTTEEFIRDAKNIHGSKYNYNLVIYEYSKTKVKIICPDHGVFKQTPSHHLMGCEGSSKCNKNFMNKDKFIEKANNIHNFKYDYSLTKYKNSKTKIKIICSEHGIFTQTPNSHLNGVGCPKCWYDFYDTKKFIEKANEIFKFKDRKSVV